MKRTDPVSATPRTAHDGDVHVGQVCRFLDRRQVALTDNLRRRRTNEPGLAQLVPEGLQHCLAGRRVQDLAAHELEVSHELRLASLWLGEAEAGQVDQGMFASGPVFADGREDRIAGAHRAAPSRWPRLAVHQLWKVWAGAGGISRPFVQVLSGL